MQGKVSLLNQTLGMAAVFTERGEFTLLHLPAAGGAALHDVLKGELGRSGRTLLYNESRGTMLAVRISECGATLMQAKGLLERHALSRATLTAAQSPI